MDVFYSKTSRFENYYNNDLKELNLSCMNIELSDLNELKLLLLQHGDIRCLNLQNNCLCPEAVRNIMYILRTHNIHLKKLNVSENMVGPASIDSVGRYIQHNIHLQELQMSGVHLGTRGTCVLASYIKGHPSLHHVNLENNCIDDSGGINMLLHFNTCNLVSDLYISKGNKCTDVMAGVVEKLGLQANVH
jgi:Ran GTPase-activating protein (RanGAP) involved in mRNA processing and transport